MEKIIRWPICIIIGSLLSSVAIGQDESTSRLKLPPQEKSFDSKKINVFWNHESFNEVDEIDRVYSGDNHIGVSYQLDETQKIRVAFRFANTLPTDDKTVIEDRFTLSDPYIEYKNSEMVKSLLGGHKLGSRHRLYAPLSESSQEQEMVARYYGRFDFSKGLGSKFSFIHRIQPHFYIHRTPRTTTFNDGESEVSANPVWKLEYLPMLEYAMFGNFYLYLAGYAGQQNFQKLNATHESEVTVGTIVSVAYVPAKHGYIELAFERYHRVDENRDGDSTSFLGLYTELAAF